MRLEAWPPPGVYGAERGRQGSQTLPVLFWSAAGSVLSGGMSPGDGGSLSARRVLVHRGLLCQDRNCYVKPSPGEAVLDILFCVCVVLR